MSRDNDWHVFDKACEITAMAARGTADEVSAAQVADIFREVFGALARGRERDRLATARRVLGSPRHVAQRHDADQALGLRPRGCGGTLLEHPVARFGDGGVGRERDGVRRHPAGEGVSRRVVLGGEGAHDVAFGEDPTSRSPSTIRAAPTCWRLITCAASDTVASSATVTSSVLMTSRRVSMAGVQPVCPVGAGSPLDWYAPRARAYAWRRGRPSAYRTLVSELMLQQTQASRVEPAFRVVPAEVPVGVVARGGVACRGAPGVGRARLQPTRGLVGTGPRRR